MPRRLDNPRNSSEGVGESSATYVSIAQALRGVLWALLFNPAMGEIERERGSIARDGRVVALISEFARIFPFVLGQEMNWTDDPISVAESTELMKTFLKIQACGFKFEKQKEAFTEQVEEIVNDRVPVSKTRLTRILTKGQKLISTYLEELAQIPLDKEMLYRLFVYITELIELEITEQVGRERTQAQFLFENLRDPESWEYSPDLVWNAFVGKQSSSRQRESLR